MTKSIEWSEERWNPTTGCKKVSKECEHCYAETMHLRLSRMGQKKYSQPFTTFVQHESELDRPFHIKKPSMIFVDSMSDLFHEKATYPFLDAVFNTMDMVNRHIYQILTKRPVHMQDFIARWKIEHNRTKIPDNIWLGVSCGIKEARRRIEILQEIPAKVRFVSFEPLLENLGNLNLEGINWAIIGGESGKNSRKMEKEWVYNIKNQCEKFGTAFFFKQWGGATHSSGGRELDGIIYDNMPVMT